MDTAISDYPVGDLRVSDADRDRALSVLSKAFQAGRITADEFDQRSRQALDARIGKELTVLLADLPADRPRAGIAGQQQARRVIAARIVMGASGIAATTLAAVSASTALSHDTPNPAKRELAQEILARMGLPVRLPPPAGFDWAGTITPAAIAVLLVVLIIVLRARVTRVSRG